MSWIRHVLGDAAWQGIAGIIALIGMVAAAIRFSWRNGSRPGVPEMGKTPPTAVEPPSVVEAPPVRPEQARRVTGQQAQYFDLSDEVGEREYYEALAEGMRNAKEKVYRVGRGFHREQSLSIYQALQQAEEAALQRKIKVVRIQVGSMVAQSWAAGYARMLADYPNFEMVADFDYTGHSDIAVVDPHGRNPFVSLLFESREQERLGTVGRAKMGFIVRETQAAGDLYALLLEQANRSQVLTAQAVRDLARTYVYFGWGVHMAARKMTQDAPGAECKGVAVLRHWRRNINAMIDRPADRATIVESESKDSDDWFDGVAYEMSWWEKERLTRLESRAYARRDVTIEIAGVPVDAFTFVPLPSPKGSAVLRSGSWIDLVKEGAIENDMTQLLSELRRAGVPFGELRPDSL
ncbi:gamma-glutamylcyclotransferase family protein [Dactylosporangium sp. McL0621]|uniref:gamma-glutamylcyclotransferase family protein n=1 Tax=Dactylosporangium sp. McL0621 TaxID=3415678 RepID=UPI003CFBB784